MARRKGKPSSQPLSVEPPADRARLIGHWGLAAVLLVTLVAYLPALRGSPLWDDDAHMTAPELQSIAGLGRIWFEIGATQQYYPLLYSAFWVEHQLWGDSVVGYHLVNVLWHLLAVALVYRILTVLEVPGALLAAAVFGVHPVMVESVAWISEQKNTLSAVFYLSAMLVYLKFDASRRPALYGLAIGLFVLGLLTKTVTASLPAALLVIFWWKRGTLSWRRDVRPLAPFFVLGLVGGLTTAWVERTLLGAQGADFNLSVVDRCVLAGRVIWFYVGKLFWPVDLTFIYPRWTIDPEQAWQWSFSLAAVTVTVWFWAIRERLRAPLAGWLYFCGTLFPALGFINVYPFIFSFVADHFQYLASLGIIVPVAAVITMALGRLSIQGRRAGIVVVVLVVGVLAGLTARQSSLYANSVVLYQTTLDRNPDCWMAHNNLGMKLAEMGDPAGAIAHYKIALELKPNYFEAHNNLGNAYARAGQLPEAIAEFTAALSVKPDFFHALNNLGVTLGRAGRYQEAVVPLQRAVELKPDYADTHNFLAMALASSGQRPAAIEHFRTAIRLNERLFDAYGNLARMLIVSRQNAQAIGVVQEAVRVARSVGDEAALRQSEELLRQLQGGQK